MENKDILLVEDNPNDCCLVLRVFRKLDLDKRVHITKDGVEALEFLSQSQKDKHEKSSLKVILLDLKMPRMTGLEFLEIVKSKEETRHLPVVILTSSNEEVDIERAYQLGVNSYLVKPVNYDVFSAAIKDITNYWLEINKTP